jgi:murein DD-endopeptidase MepM/ murein hydrolase activator NlpD
VEGRIVAEFGVKRGVQHNGVSIEAAEGAPVMAVQDGKVGHVGSIPGYGNVILIEHQNRLVTVYAHLKEMKVSPGKTVKQGSIIATVGSTGRTDQPQLYFEIRSKSKPRNPLFFLKKKT